MLPIESLQHIKLESPPAEKLAAVFREMTGRENVVALELERDGLYGVMCPPLAESRPEVIVSSDIDDVQRDLAGEFMGYVGLKANDACRAGDVRTHYEDVMGYTSDHICRQIVHVSDAGTTPPLPGYRRVRNILREFGQNDIYRPFTTAATAGSEEGVLRWSLKTFDGQIDAMLFAGAFHEAGTTTKAGSLRTLAGKLGTVRHVMHVDDVPHHLKPCMDDAILSIMPVYRWGEQFADQWRDDPNFIAVKRPVHAFELIRKGLREHFEAQGKTWRKAA